MYVARSQGSRSRSRRDSSRATCTRYIQQQIYTHAYFDYRLLQAAGHPASRPFTCTTPASQQNHWQPRQRSRTNSRWGGLVDASMAGCPRYVQLLHV